MYRNSHVYTKQLIAVLLMAVMVLVHAGKTMHHHGPCTGGHKSKHPPAAKQLSQVHPACSICDFQLAKDTPFTGDITLVIAPVTTAPTFSRLLTSINPDRLFVTDGRGPPRA